MPKKRKFNGAPSCALEWCDAGAALQPDQQVYALCCCEKHRGKWEAQEATRRWEQEIDHLPDGAATPDGDMTRAETGKNGAPSCALEWCDAGAALQEDQQADAALQDGKRAYALCCCEAHRKKWEKEEKTKRWERLYEVGNGRSA